MVPDSKLLTIAMMVLLLQVKFILNNEGKFPGGGGGAWECGWQL